jgi:hypothetical protein
VAEGWDSHETILHLGAADRFAHLTLTDPASFSVEHHRLSAGEVSLNGLIGPEVPALSGRDLWSPCAEVNGVSNSNTLYSDGNGNESTSRSIRYPLPPS